MGQLALWGAIGGAAQGAKEGILMKAESEAKQEEREYQSKQSDIDFKRQQALERLKQRHAEKLEGMRQEGATERTTIGAETDVKVQEMRNTQSASNVQAETTARERINEADIEGRKAIEKMGIDAGKYERTGSGSDVLRKALVDRYEAKVLTVSQANEQFPGLSIENDTPAIFDKVSGTWYLQKGDKYIPAGMEDRQVARAPQDAVKYLYDNPQYAADFAKPKNQGGYGYLPSGFFPILRIWSLNNAGYDAYGNEQQTEE